MKRGLVYGIFLLLAFNLKAQTFHGGVIMGLVASQVDGDSYSGYDKIGFTGGIFVTKSLGNIILARLEIRYASRGARNPASEDHTGLYNLTLHYVDIPVMTEFRIRDLGFIETGLCPGYRFGAGGEDDAGNLPDEYLQDIRRFDMGLILGLQIKLTPKTSVIARYSYSLFSIRSGETAGSYYSWFGKIFGYSTGDFNNYLTLGLSYRIR